MFARISTFTLDILIVPLLVVSNAVPMQETSTTVTGGRCNTGSAQCCKSVQDPKSDAIQNVLGLLGIPIGDITAQVLTCAPITVLGLVRNVPTNQSAAVITIS
ncbi:hypothetical protein DFS33DRAFT_1482971 [Desarmillaria ectypa]|nr:hypothetical protein DFS33DRAFT_1482971 [Desarmillaria ectypa]